MDLFSRFRTPLPAVLDAANSRPKAHANVRAAITVAKIHEGTVTLNVKGHDLDQQVMMRLGDTLDLSFDINLPELA